MENRPCCMHLKNDLRDDCIFCLRFQVEQFEQLLEDKRQLEEALYDCVADLDRLKVAFYYGLEKSVAFNMEPYANAYKLLHKMGSKR